MAVLGRAVLFALAWWAVSDGQLAYAAYGVPSVVLATAASLWLLPPRRERPRSVGEFLQCAGATLRLVGWYLVRMTAGAADVARRALARPVDIDPVVVEAPLRLPPGVPRTLALGMVNLMPGSLVQHVGEQTIELHVLSAEMDAVDAWAALEERMAAAAGLTLPSQDVR